MKVGSPTEIIDTFYGPLLFVMDHCPLWDAQYTEITYFWWFVDWFVVSALTGARRLETPFSVCIGRTAAFQWSHSGDERRANAEYTQAGVRIVRRIRRVHESRDSLDRDAGLVEVESAPGRGTRVRLDLPEGPPDAGELPLTPAAEAAARSAVDGDGREPRVRILLVEDHQIVREGLIAMLERQPDLEVIGEAADGQTAVEIARDLSPDVILMDVSLPGINGVAATHHITMTMPGVRVIGLSAIEEEAMGLSMGEAGAVAYVTKGGRSSELVAAIRSAAGRG